MSHAVPGNPAEGIVGLLSSVITDQPSMPLAACRNQEQLYDQAALGDPLAQQRAVELCHQCPCLASCTAWAATLSRRQRAELGVLAGIAPVRRPPPVTQPEPARKPASVAPGSTGTTKQGRSDQQRQVGAARALAKRIGKPVVGASVVP